MTARERSDRATRTGASVAKQRARDPPSLKLRRGNLRVHFRRRRLACHGSLREPEPPFWYGSERAKRASHANGASVAKQRARERVGGSGGAKPPGKKCAQHDSNVRPPGS